MTLKGDVRLTGVLNEQARIDEAVKVARSAAGAHSVHDEFTLKNQIILRRVGSSTC